MIMIILCSAFIKILKFTYSLFWLHCISEWREKEEGRRLSRHFTEDSQTDGQLDKGNERADLGNVVSFKIVERYFNPCATLEVIPSASTLPMEIPVT